MSKRQKIPEGSVWKLCSLANGAVMQDDIFEGAAETAHLFRGDTDAPLATVPVGEGTGIEFDGEGRRLRFVLFRKA